MLTRPAMTAGAGGGPFGIPASFCSFLRVEQTVRPTGGTSTPARRSGGGSVQVAAHHAVKFVSVSESARFRRHGSPHRLPGARP